MECEREGVRECIVTENRLFTFLQMCGIIGAVGDPSGRLEFLIHRNGFERVYMKTAKVTVVPYDEAWSMAFEKIKKELEAALGALAVGIEHVGSTSVVGMSAKPCIDIDVIIRDYSVWNEVMMRLGDIGYIHEGDLGIKDREAFRYLEKTHLQKHHLYVCPQYSEELHRHLVFRDFLRGNPVAAKRYSLVKEQAAEHFPNDIDGYVRYKSTCICELYKACGLQ